MGALPRILTAPAAFAKMAEAVNAIAAAAEPVTTLHEGAGVKLTKAKTSTMIGLKAPRSGVGATDGGLAGGQSAYRTETFTICQNGVPTDRLFVMGD